MLGKTKRSAAYNSVRILLAALGLVWWLSHAANRGGQAFEITSLSSTDDEKSEKERFQGGASLKTEPDLESRLERARLFAEEGTYNHASTLWQNVLNQSGDTLITRDGRTYVSLAEDVERTIAKLPKAGLRIYRITADGEAQAILADGVGDKEEQALAEVVRKYFVSSLGDDAAYKLGCIALDNYDFVGASRLFRKILENHPDPSVPLSNVWMRLAVATAHLGDIRSAREALSKAEKVIGEKPPAEVFELVRADIEQAGESAVRVASSSQDWPMAMGNPARSGQMRALSDGATTATLTRMWGYQFPLDFNSNSLRQDQVYLSRAYGRSRQPIEISTDEKSLIKKWKSKEWRPAHQLLMADGRVYFKTGNDLTCWNMEGESDKPVWRTAWANRFEVDSMTRMLQMMMARMGNTGSPAMLNRPASEVEIMLFGDRIHQSMSISRGTIFSIEGKQYAKQVSQRPSPTNRNVNWNYGVVPRRTRKNWLAAYDARTGKALWHRSAADNQEDSESEAAGDVGFMAAPVPYGNLLLAPVSDGGTLWLYALARQNGETVWRTYLCDEPSGGCKPWSPVGLSVDGRDVYLLCGAGVFFAIDATTGTIRFAVRYERVAPDNNTAYRRFGYTAPTLSLDKGWEDDVAIPYRNALVVMASDSDKLFAVDRRTGEFLWDSPRTPLDHTAEYAVGVTQDGGFIVGGKNCVRRYDIITGLLKWQTVVESSYGRAMLTADAVYVPVKNTIVRLDVKDGSVDSQATVSLTSDDPVGNLYSDGEKIWVAGANKIYALTNLQQRLAILEKRIKRGDANAHIERMKLLAKDDKLGPAVEDMLNAYEIVLGNEGDKPAAALLFDAVRAIQLQQRQPQVVLEIMSKRFVKDGSASSLGEELESQRTDLTVSSLTAIHRQGISGAAAAVLDAVPLLGQPYQWAEARRALASTATEDDVALLRAAVESGQPTQQLTAINAFVSLAKDEAKKPLKKLSQSSDELVRLSAARGLVNAGDRDGLTSLAELLNAKATKVRAGSAAALRHATGKRFGFTAYDDEAKRLAAQKSWTEWLAESGDTVQLNLPIPDHASLLGRTLIAYYSRNVLVELDENGKKRWEKNVSRPWSCQGLPNGHRLVASYTRKEIIEFDAEGNEVWKQSSLPTYPFSVRRLDNGNTLVTCPNSNQVIEYKQDHSIAWQTSISSRPADAHRLENGNTLVALTGTHKVVEVNHEGKVVWEVSGMSNAMSAQRLENGNTLIALSNSGVVEVDRDKSHVWTSPRFSQCYDAQRLPNGNTLLIGNDRVQEVDPNGKVVWQGTDSGARGLSRF